MLNFFRRGHEPEPPPPELEHPQLGSVICTESGWWEGHRVVDGYNLMFNVDGDDNGPDPHLVQNVVFVLSHFSSFWEEAQRLIRHEAGKFGIKDIDAFTPNTICNFCTVKDNTSYFMLYLSVKGDEYSLWRVEFYDGKAKYLGCDT